MSDVPAPMMARLRASLDRLLRDVDTTELPRYRVWGVQAVRVAFALGRDIAEGQLTLRAMSLVYTTLLSLVPLLAISFSVLKGFGVHNQIEPLLINLLAPLGEKGFEIAERIVDFVENVKVGVLGSVGLALLFYIVISLMQKIERAVNYIWHITRERSLMQRFRDYLSVIVVGPVLVFSSMGITASLLSAKEFGAVAAIGPIGTLIDVTGRLVPYIMIVAAFTFIYIFIPNTKVRLRSALIGGLFAGILWNLIGWLFASFVVTSVRYAAIYSTFATLIMFMIWLYLAWLILLVGASISFYHQRPEYTALNRGRLVLANHTWERIALLIAFLIARRFYNGEPPWTADALAHRTGAPAEAVERVLDQFERRNILAVTGGEPPAYLPARPFETMRVADVLDAIRTPDGRTQSLRIAPVPAVDAMMADIEQATAAALGDKTLKDLAEIDPSEDLQSSIASISR